MNGGKDVKIGHDKRPVSVVPSDQQPLYNIANGEILTDEFGNPLITNVDQFFLADASTERSTSVVFPSQVHESQTRRLIRKIGIATGTYGVNFNVSVVITNVGYGTKHALIVDQVNGGLVGLEQLHQVKLVLQLLLDQQLIYHFFKLSRSKNCRRSGWR